MSYEIIALDQDPAARPIYCTSGRRSGVYRYGRGAAGTSRISALDCKDREARWIAVEGEYAWQLCDRCLPLVTGVRADDLRPSLT
jgi:hypothetical protein